ncbi:MAG TPA: sugar phosphate isomerase/epimerase family protein [Verrucomicrobiae bacterium]|nr:sugar phosphate isomerase/epimerase family protein [Verrucomicrobiae bacterium]
MRLGICNEIFKDWKLAEAMAYARRVGYDAIEIAPFTLANYVTEISSTARQQIKDDAARAGIAVSGIHWVLVQAEGMYLNHPEAAVRTRTARYFCDLVDFCADLGGRSIVVGSPKQRNVMEGVSQAQAWEWASQTFKAAVQQAGERDVTICFEPLAPTETNFINTAEDAIRFVSAHHSPHFKIILDVKAMCSESKPIPQIIRESWPHFAYFHANDRNLKGPGFGEVDFMPIVSALREVGYDGTISVEVFKFEEGPEVIATRSLQYLRQVLG